MTAFPEQNSGQVEFLYGSFVGTQEKFDLLPLHRHIDYWQLEIPAERIITLVSSDLNCQLLPGSAVLVPPGIFHTFLYPQGPSAFATVKFKVAGEYPQVPIDVLNPDPVESYFLTEILRLLKARPPEFERAVSFLTGNLFFQHYSKQKNELSGLVGIIDNLSSSSGERLQIQELARRSGYSRDYLNRVIRGRFGVSLKEYVDQKLASRARRYLAYSECSVSEVASQLGFPDIYSFSRFFSRLNNGLSPSAYRRKKIGTKQA